MTPPRYWHLSRSFLPLACAAIVALWDFLFWDRPLGCSAAVFAAAFLLLLLLRAPGLWRHAAGRVVALLALGMVAALVEEPSPLAILMSIAAAGTLILISRHDVSFADRVSDWIVRWIILLLTIPLRFLLDNFIVFRWLRRHPRLAGRLARAATILAWWVLPLLAGLLFVGLFTLANPIIENWMRHALDQLWQCLSWLLFLSPSRIFLWIVVGMCAYGLLRYRRLLGRPAQPVAVPPVVTAGNWFNGPQMIVRCLLVFNAVFALQSALDALYLFAGAHLPAGMTFAHYAHRGAYPLVATALLAGAFVLLAFKTGGPAHRSRWCRRLVYLWIAQNLFLLVSTLWRVWLYVDAYSLTRLRVAALIWIALVAFGFLWIVGRILLARTNTWLWRMNAATLFVVLYLCAFINFDGLIADFNVRHCREVDGAGAPIDLVYLQDLGPDSLPALQWLREHRAGGAPRTAAAVDSLTAALNAELSDWRGWTCRRWRQSSARYLPPELVSR